MLAGGDYHANAFREGAASPEGDAAVVNGAKAPAMMALNLLTSQAYISEVRRAFEIASGEEA